MGTSKRDPVPTHVALLRAVNLPGHQPLTSAALRDVVAAAGMRDVETLLQTGNALFTADDPTDLGTRIAAALRERTGWETDVIVRTAAEWRDLVAANPFPHAADADPGHLLAMPLTGFANPSRVAELQASIRDREQVAAVGANLYLVYPDGVGRSKLTAARIERALGVRGTARNWNTVRKVAERLGV